MFTRTVTWGQTRRPEKRIFTDDTGDNVEDLWGVRRLKRDNKDDKILERQPEDLQKRD